MMFAGTEVLAGPVLVTIRSATAPTEAVDVLLLFPGVGSGVDELTVAVLLTLVPLLTAAVSVKLADAPAANVAAVQVTVLVPLQLNAGPLV